MKFKTKDHGKHTTRSVVPSPSHYENKITGMLVQSQIIHAGPGCKKTPTPNCVKLGHLYNCPRHAYAYCIDKEGQTCVLCQGKWEREEKELEEEKRMFQEAVVAAALADRTNYAKAGKAQWGNKLPTPGQLAKTAAQKAREASKAEAQRNAKWHANGKAEKAWKGFKGGKPARFHEAQDATAEKAPKPEQEKTKGKNKLRIQRGQ